MLVSLTRVGASRQTLGKTVAVLGADGSALTRQAGRLNAEPFDGVPGLYTVSLKSAWLGTLEARNRAFAELARSVVELASATQQIGGAVVPAGIGLLGRPALLGGDIHVIEVLSAVEQEVLVNLLRTKVPMLIAMTGRGVTASGLPRDRTGSRWLAGSKAHLSTRYLASTEPAHLERIKAELRRRDGISRLDRMDVTPAEMPDGTTAVAVRCVDSAASIPTARAHALVLAALALQARRLVRDGSRVGNAPQRTLEENRARAIAYGLRARFEMPVQAGRRGERSRETSPVDARDAVRRMLLDLCPEFANLEATAEELAPVILPVELPRLGLRSVATDDEVLAGSARRGDSFLVATAAAGLADSTPGGHLLASATRAAPGRASIVLGKWRSSIAEPRTASGGRPQQRERRSGQQGRSQPPGQSRRDHRGPDDRRSDGTGGRTPKGNG